MKYIGFVLLFSIVYTLSYAEQNNNFYVLKMQLYIEMQDYTNAERFIRKIDFDKLDENKKAVIYNKIGFVYYKLKKYRYAFKNYFSALKYDSKLYYVYNNIGILYFHWDEYNNAKKYYLKALRLNSKYPKVLVNLAVVDFYLRNYESAYEWYKKAKKIDKNYVKKRFNKKKGLEKLRALVKKYPDDKELQRLLKWAVENYNKTKLFD